MLKSGGGVRVSFVLPAYKRKHLGESIASILAQTVGDFELIVVDDASPEHLEEIVRGFDDCRISYRRNERNLGGENLVAAWNHAMTFATGEWAVLASDDDIYHPDYLKELLDLADRFPSCDLFHCRVQVIDSKGRIVESGDERVEHETIREFLKSRGVQRLRQMAPDFMFRLRRLREIGGFIDFPLAWYSDEATWYAVARKGGVACSPQFLFQWRASGANISRRHELLGLKTDAGLLFLRWIRGFLKSVDCADLYPKIKESNYYALRMIFKQAPFACKVSALLRFDSVRRVLSWVVWRKIFGR